MQSPSSNTLAGNASGAAITAAPPRTSGRSRLWTAIEPWLYLAPALICFLALVIVPAIGTVILSFTSWNGISWSSAAFIGFENYVDIVRDARFRNAFLNNLQLIPFYVFLPAIIGIIPAAFIPQLRLKWTRWFEAGLFLPYVMPGVLIGVVWAWILNPVFGPVNKTLKLMDLKPPTWLGDFTWALPTVGMIGAWSAYGFCYVVFLAGVQKISKELYEAARIDGAGLWQEFRSVTLPGLRREIAVVLSLNVINAMRAFDVVKATTDGGPGEETQVMALYMINSAFNANMAGYGTAIAVLLSLITLGGSALVLKLFGERDD